MIDFSTIKAAMFDFDGTVTEKGKYEPPQTVVNALIDLSQKLPIGFCTGRQWESFEEHGLTELLREISPLKRLAFLKNLFLFAENGAIGYEFDENEQEFREFYRIPWPEKFIAREELQKALGEAIKNYGQVYSNAHRVVVVMRTILHDTEGRDVEEVYRLSDKIYKICLKFLKKYSADYEEFVHVGNSGIGVIIGPANGDKDEGIRRFADRLKQKRGMGFSPELREILVAGDSPQLGGNDHYFLQGKIGTAFNVGEWNIKNPVLRPVINKNNKRLFNSKATLFLINNLL